MNFETIEKKCPDNTRGEKIFTSSSTLRSFIWRVIDPSCVRQTKKKIEKKPD